MVHWIAFGAAVFALTSQSHRELYLFGIGWKSQVLHVETIC